MQQQQTRVDINMKESMQPKQRQHEMMHMQQDQREQPPPINKNQQRERLVDNIASHIRNAQGFLQVNSHID